MDTDEEMFEKISDRIAQSKGDCALLLIDRIIEAMRSDGIKIESMGNLCRSVVSGQFNDPAAAYALADFTHEIHEAEKVKREAMRMMVEDERHDQTTSDGG
jgi:hypothetical protein